MEELIKQCAREGADGFDWFDGDTACEAAGNAIRLYHARHVAPLVEAVKCTAAPDEASMTGWSDEYIRGWAYAAARIARETLAPFQAPKEAEAEPCSYCGDGDRVPAQGYWRCPKCDAEWNEENPNAAD